MKRYYYNNILAKVLLHFSTCHTITLGWFVLSKRSPDEISQEVKNHETIHSMQWMEVTMVSGSLILYVVLMLDVSPLWLLASPIVYYIWYIFEWICKLPFENAYHSISFEQEAFANEDNDDYCENRHLFFGWMKNVVKNIK